MGEMSHSEYYFSEESREPAENTPDGRFNCVLREQPELAQFVPRDLRARAQGVFPGLRRFLKENPRLAEWLEDAHAQTPDRVTMMVIPERSIVLARFGEVGQVITPTLICTELALDELSAVIKPQERAHLFRSTIPYEEMHKNIWHAAARDPLRVLSYDPSKISPENYVALAATGMLSNEVYRIGLRVRQ